MTQFLPARIFSVSVLGYGCRVVRLGLRASLSGVQMGIPGLGEERTGCEKMVRGSKWQWGACLGTRAWRGPTINCAARLFLFIPSFSFPFRSLDPTSPFLLFYSYLAIRDSD
jgi:hypothetical protein